MILSEEKCEYYYPAINHLAVIFFKNNFIVLKRNLHVTLTERTESRGMYLLNHTNAFLSFSGTKWNRRLMRQRDTTRAQEPVDWSLNEANCLIIPRTFRGRRTSRHAHSAIRFRRAIFLFVTKAL